MNRTEYPDAPNRLVLRRIGGRWTATILLALSEGPLRFGELKARAPSITAKVLIETLRTLQRDGFVYRTELLGTPPPVEYALTPLGSSLLRPLTEVLAWTDAHSSELLDARSRFSDADGHPRRVRD